MFNENQVRQFYVAGASKTVAPFVAGSGTNSNIPTNASDAGAMQLVTNGDEAYFLYKGPSDDGLQRSDLINKCNIKSVTCTDAAYLKHKMLKAIITLDSSLVSSSNLVATADYVLNVDIHSFLAMDYNSIKSKYGVARGVAGASASSLYKTLALSLAKNMGREPITLVDVYLVKSTFNATTATASSYVKVTSKTAASSLTDTYIGICIEEAEQPWRRGAAPQEFVEFTVEPSTIYYNSQDVTWGKVQFYGNSLNTDGTTGTTIGAPYALPNSKKVADMEWFFHKERGDQYGEQCWPYNIDTVYQVDPSNTDGYSFVDIHFYFEGNSHNIGHSEKTITIVGAKSDLKTLIGSAADATTTPATAATGLYAFLDGTNVSIKTVGSW